MTDTPPLSYDLHSDEDGDLHLHSDDPASASWQVVVVGRRLGDDDFRETVNRIERSVALPALNYQIPLSAWFVDRGYCHLEITDETGTHHMVGTCPHQHHAHQAKLCSVRQPGHLGGQLMPEPETSITGRLLPYCDGCRTDANTRIRGLTIPMSMLRLDPDRLLNLIYTSGASRSDPDIVAELLGIDRSSWYDTARRAAHPCLSHPGSGGELD